MADEDENPLCRLNAPIANAVRVAEDAAEKPLDGAVYIMRIWQATFGAETEYDDVPF